jgi:N-acetylglucosaminyl-diphospho-decaprenol L-rhamnosyltransferase
MLPADLGIVVVSHGRPDLLERNLVELGRSVRGDQVVVVDNFCGIAQRDATTALCGREGWTLLAPALDLGFAAAANAAVQVLTARGCRRLMILNPEVRISPADVLTLAEGCAADPQRILGPRLRTEDAATFGGDPLRTGVFGARAAGRPPRGRPGSACLMIHAALWRWLDGFDESYFLYWEDVDLCWRAVAAGGGATVRDDVIAVRGGNSSAAASEGVSTLQVYSHCRNRLAFAVQHLGRRQLLHWLMLSPVHVGAVLRDAAGARRANGWPLLVAALRGTAAGVALAVGRLAALSPAGGGGAVRLPDACGAGR